MDKSQTQYYRSNFKYSQFLEQGKVEDFKLYIDEIFNLAKTGEKVLDLGCGTGIVVDTLAKGGLDAYGAEVSKTSIALAKRKRAGRFYLYDGTQLPFDSEFFDLVGSFNVIEHVDNVLLFLDESLRVLRPGGYLLIAAPNFLSITSSYHYRTRGVMRKIKNLGLMSAKSWNFLFGKKVIFEKFPPIVRKNFQPDDDAVNLINPLDVLKWGKIENLKLTKFWGAIMPKFLSYLLKDLPFVNLLTGGVFVVFQKPK